MSENLHALIEQWRASAKELEFVATAENQGMYDGAEEEANDAVAQTLYDCATQVEALLPGGFCCAECGTTMAPTFVVTTLDYDYPKNTRTEVCRGCDDRLRAEQRPRREGT